MRRKNILPLLILTVATAATVQAEQKPVCFVNTGKMAVATNSGKVSLYIPHSALMVDKAGATTSNVSIVQQGITSLGGSFYQESKSTVFKVDDDGWGTSTGTIKFSGDNTDGERFIRTRSVDAMDDFDRASQYVAFPHILIATDDVIRIPGRMGIDAATIAYNDDEEGLIYLHSDVNDDEDKVFDASLRISATGISDASNRTSAKLVAAGSVVVEKDVSIYRTSNGILFPFAAPFTNLRSGYFAGNFVRQLLEDSNYAGHVTYVLGNGDLNGDGTIDRDQYLVTATDEFTPGKGYFIKPRTSDFDYSTLHFSLTDADPLLYDKGTFVFDGNLYNLDGRTKQLFAEDKLFDLSLSGVSYDKTVNLIIGNSYTSAISVDKLYDALANTNLTVSPIVYYYAPGLASWQPYDISANSPSLNDPTDFPAMTSFMIRLSRNQIQTGSLAIGRSMQTHGATSSNMLRSGIQIDNELLFKVYSDGNENVRDLAAVALRPSASGSISKVSNPDKDVFQLWAGNKQSVLVESTSATVIPLGFRASTETTDYTLAVSRIESMTTEGLWLEDRQMNTWINLRETDTYAFTGKPGDSEERFFVHFTAQGGTGMGTGAGVCNTPLQVGYNNGAIYINNLAASDLTAMIKVGDMQGRIVLSSQVSTYPQETIRANLVPGVYLVHIGGERNQTVKLLVKGGGR